MTDVEMKVRSAPSDLVIENSTDQVRILVLSDLHLPHNLAAARRILQSRKFLNNADFVVLLGDQCGSFGDPQEYRAVDNFIEQLGRPYTAINGNHEFFFETPSGNAGRGGHSWRELDKEGKQLKLLRFRDFFGFDSLWRARDTPLGIFIFLGLDDVDRSKPETLTQNQWRFLEANLRRDTKKPVFIFCHAPVLFDNRLDLVYYDESRTACVEPGHAVRLAMQNRSGPVFWVSGHIHLRPDHYLYQAYCAVPNVWQVHCPDSWGFSRWLREHNSPLRHGELYSRTIEVAQDRVDLVTFDYIKQSEIQRQSIEF